MALEPIQIDFIIGGNIDTKSKDIRSHFSTIEKAAENAQDEAKKAVLEQVKVFRQIEKEIASVEKQINAAAPTEGKDALTAELNAVKKIIEEEKIVLNDYRQTLEQNADATTTLRTSTVQLYEELSAMEQAGTSTALAYQSLSEQLKAIAAQMGNTSTQAEILADPQRGFKAAAEGLEALNGVMTAASAVASIFTDDQKELERITQRLQMLMQITNGLQQASNLLNKDSYFQLVLLTKAKNLFAVATNGLSVALGISNVAARALMATLTGGLALVIPAIISLIDRWRDSEKKKAEESKKIAEAERAKAKELADSYGAEQAKIQALRTALDSDNVTRREKMRIIGELKKAMPGYTAELDKEGNVIRENKKAIDEYMKSLDKRLRYGAAKKELEGLYSDLRVEEDNPFVQGALEKRKNRSSIYPIGMSEVESKMYDQGIKFNDIILQQYDKIQAKIAAIKQEIVDEGLIPTTTDTTTQSQKPIKEEYNAVADLQKQIENIRNKSAALQIKQQEDSLNTRLSNLQRAEQDELKQITANNAEIVRKWNERYPDKAVQQITPEMSVKEQTDILNGISPTQAAAQLAEVEKLTAAYSAAQTEQREQAKNKIKEIEDQITNNSLAAREKELLGVKETYDKMEQEIARNFETQNIPPDNTKLTEARRQAEAEVNLKYDKADLERERGRLDLLAELNQSSIAILDTTNLQKLKNEEDYNNKMIAKYQDFGEKYKDETLALQVRNKQIQQEVIKSVASTANNAVGHLKTAFGGLNEGLDTAMNAVGSVLSGFASGGLLGGISAAVGVITKGIQSIIQNAKEAEKELTKAQNAYTIAQIEETRTKKEGAEGVFYDSYLKDFQRANQAMTQANTAFNKEVKKQKSIADNAKTHWTYTKTYNDLVKSTRQLFGTTDIDSFDRKKLDILLTNAKINKSQNQQGLLQLQALLKQYDEAKKQMETVMNSLFGELGSSLGDALLEGFKAGEDGLAAFEKSFEQAMSKMLDSLVINMIVDAAFGGVLDLFKKEVSDALETGDSTEIANVFGKLSEALQDRYGEAVQAVQVWENAKIAVGLPGIGEDTNAAVPTNQSSISGAFQTMSQDTADVLTGQFTAIRQHTTFIPIISQNVQEQMRTVSLMLAVQYEIANNTGITAQVIQEIKADFQSVRTNGLRVI